MKAKSIRKQKVEGEFGSLLCKLTPAPELFAIAKTMLRDLWDARMSQTQCGAAQSKRKSRPFGRRQGNWSSAWSKPTAQPLS